MKNAKRLIKTWSASITGLSLLFASTFAIAATPEELDKKADIAMEQLYRTSPVAKKLASQANGVLVFPSIIKAGFVFGGQHGKGVLRVDGETQGYYKSTALSYGFQAGAQRYGYAMFLMTPEAMNYLENSYGWEVGVGPNIVVVDAGIAKSLTTTSAKEDIYVFFFDQEGLMAGVGLQGSKISEINM